MTDTSTSPSPAPMPPPSPESVIHTSHERLHHPLALFVVAVLASLGAALAIGFPIGAMVAGAAMNDCSPSDGWCGLGAVLAGALFGGVAGLVAYVGTGVAVVRRCRSAGRRAGHIAAHIVSPFLLLVLLGFASNL